MRTSARIPGTGLVLAATAALLLSGCVAAGIATVAAGGGLGYAFSREQPETTASAAPAGSAGMKAEPATSSGLDNRGHPVATGETSGWQQPTALTEPQAPVERVEVQPLQ